MVVRKMFDESSTKLVNLFTNLDGVQDGLNIDTGRICIKNDNVGKGDPLSKGTISASPSFPTGAPMDGAAHHQTTEKEILVRV